MAVGNQPTSRELLANKQKEDPWKHRHMNMSCRTCMWFIAKGSGDIGRCRKRAPTISGYPVVFTNDWCRDHKLDETANLN